MLIRGKLGGVSLGDDKPPRIMGAINLTRNSFFKGSIAEEPEKILKIALQMENEGADIIDIGARSTAPYRTIEVPEFTETKLIERVTKVLARKLSVPISIDTTRVGPAKAGLDCGARIINDVYGLTQKNHRALSKLVIRRSASYIMTAHETRPGKIPDPLERVIISISKSLEKARMAGFDFNQIVIDPGIGFFRDRRINNVEWNCTILARLNELRTFSLPVMVGLSRKSFIGAIDSGKPPENRLPGSLAGAAISILNYCHAIRTHDVEETKQAIMVAKTIRQYSRKRPPQHQY